nr:ORF5A [synthetic construct]
MSKSTATPSSSPETAGTPLNDRIEGVRVTSISEEKQPTSSVTSSFQDTMATQNADVTDATDYKKPPAETEQKALTIQPRSNKAPSDEELVRIINAAQKRGLTPAAFVQAAIIFTMESMDKGATDSTIFTGKHNTFPMKSLALACKDAGVPVHKLCYFYTKPAYANRRVANQPPARWTNENVPKANKWAAFDTFDALLDPYVVPSSVPYDEPTPEDRQVNEIFKKDNLSQAASRNQLLGTQASITRGRLNGAPALPNNGQYFIEAPQ